MAQLKPFLIFSLQTAVFSLGKCWPGFQVLTERTEVTYNNKDCVEMKIKTGRSNRTTIMSNGTFHVYQQLPKGSVVRVIGYEFKSNEYRRSIIDISKYLCDYYYGEYTTFFKKTFEKCGHVPESCPFDKGYYYWNNFVMEANYIPFKPIGERWMFEGNLTFNDLLLTRILWYTKIKRNADFYRKG